MQVSGSSLAVGLPGQGSLTVRGQGADVGSVCCPGGAFSLAGAPSRHRSCFSHRNSPWCGFGGVLRGSVFQLEEQNTGRKWGEKLN